MAAKSKTLDVWIVETNTVYRQVPFTVVVDWVQQGRLLEDDQLRPSGTTEWQRLGTMPAFAPYLPKADPHRAEDTAEALEPVQVDFAWKPRGADDEEDVDMIPLIDVSLVLLIFFMMTASVMTAPSLIPTPGAAHGAQISGDPTTVWIGIDKGPTGEPLYSLGKGDRGPGEEDRKLSEAEVLKRFDQRLETERAVDVRIKGHKRLPYEVVKRLTLAVDQRRPKVRQIFAEVSESANP